MRYGTPSKWLPRLKLVRHDKKRSGATMNIKLRYLATVLGAGAVAAAIVSAPGAAAASVTTTRDSGGATTTERPGHVAIHAEPPMVSPPRVWGSFSSPLFILGD